MTVPIDISPDDLETVRKILAEHVPEHEVRAFGSRVNWTARQYSDLDLAVMTQKPLDILRISDLCEAFTQSDLPFRVDALDWADTSENFRKIIEKEYVVVQQGTCKRKPDGWQKFTIGEIAEIVGGGTPSTKEPENFDGNIPWITPKDLSGPHDRYIGHGKRNLSQKGLENSSAKLLPSGSILLSTRAPIGYVALAKNPIATNQGFRSLVVKEDFSQEYLYYWLVQNTGELKRHASGSTFQELSGSALKTISLHIPPLPEQHTIAHILGTLDDKIELNRRMSETLESIAQALFKSWFVDFDPVRAKMKGRWQRGESLPGLPADLWELFPDRMIESEIGEVPEGWKICDLENCFDLTMGQSPPGHTYNEDGNGMPFFQGCHDFSSRYPENRKFCTDPNRIAKSEDTLVSVRAPVGDINMAWEECCIGRGLVALRHKSGSISFTYYSAWALQEQLRKYEYTGTVFGAINKKQLGKLKIKEPSAETIVAFELLVAPLDKQIRQNTAQIRTLTILSNVLLPKLISGELRVNHDKTI